MEQVNKSLADQKQLAVMMKNLQETQLLKKQWTHIAGTVIAEHVTMEYIKHDECVVSVHTPCWAHELQFYEKQLLDKINTCLKRRKKIKRVIAKSFK